MYGAKKKSTKPKVINYERVKGYMLWLVEKYGDYSSKKLLQKANMLFSEDTQYNQSALDYLIDRDIVNDLRYAKRLAMSLSSRNLGLNKIKQKLYAKGFATQTINEALTTIENTDEDYFEKALTLKNRKFGNNPIEEHKTQQKALRHLIGQGFTYAIANKAIKYSYDEI